MPSVISNVRQCEVFHGSVYKKLGTIKIVFVTILSHYNLYQSYFILSWFIACEIYIKNDDNEIVDHNVKEFSGI